MLLKNIEEMNLNLWLNHLCYPLNHLR